MRRVLACSTLALVLAGCATAPSGPRVAVMPAPGKPLEVFEAEDRYCRSYAEQSIGQTRNEAAAQNFAGAAAVGTAVGAVAGSLSGGHGSAGSGAATGLAVGSMVGAGQSGEASQDAQWRYDIAYQQCMYSKGNQIPGAPLPPYYPPPRR